MQLQCHTQKQNFHDGAQGIKNTEGHGTYKKSSNLGTKTISPKFNCADRAQILSRQSSENFFKSNTNQLQGGGTRGCC